MRGFCRMIAGAFVLGGSILVATGCAAGTGRLYVRVGPPTPVIEVRAIPPGPGYVWVPGYYRWDGFEYVWAPGRWMLPPRPFVVWTPAHWVREPGGWYFVQGRWR